MGYAVAALLLFDVVALLAVRVSNGNAPLRVDTFARRVIDFVSPAHAQPQIVKLGSPGVVLLLGLFLGVLSWERGDLRGAALAAVGPLAAGLLVEDLVKPLVGRTTAGTSLLAFPSGQATGAAAIATVALILAYRRWGRQGLRRWALVYLIPLAVGTGLVRTAQHYATDVVAGIAFGTGVVLLLAACLTAWETRRAATT